MFTTKMACIGVHRSYKHKNNFFREVLEWDDYQYTTWFHDEDFRSNKRYRTIKSFIVSRMSRAWILEWNQKQDGIEMYNRMDYLQGYCDNRQIIRIGLKTIMQTDRAELKHRLACIHELNQTNLVRDCIIHIMSYL